MNAGVKREKPRKGSKCDFSTSVRSTWSFHSGRRSGFFAIAILLKVTNSRRSLTALLTIYDKGGIRILVHSMSTKPFKRDLHCVLDALSCSRISLAKDSISSSFSQRSSASGSSSSSSIVSKSRCTSDETCSSEGNTSDKSDASARVLSSVQMLPPMSIFRSALCVSPCPGWLGPSAVA